jgi:hypothetical protein
VFKRNDGSYSIKTFSLITSQMSEYSELIFRVEMRGLLKQVECPIGFDCSPPVTKKKRKIQV